VDRWTRHRVLSDPLRLFHPGGLGFGRPSPHLALDCVIHGHPRQPPEAPPAARLVPQSGVLFPLLRVISGEYRQF
jgi:hypothetical protein